MFMKNRTKIILSFLISFQVFGSSTISENEANWSFLIPPGGYAYAELHAEGIGEFTCVFPAAPGPWFGPDDPALEQILTGTALETLEIIPPWMQEWLRVRLGDLIAIPLDVGLCAQPEVVNLNNDNMPDLAVLAGDGSTHFYLAPYWTKTEYEGEELIPVYADINNDGKDDIPSVGNNGEIIVSTEGIEPDTLNDINLYTASGVAFGDVDSDGLFDLVIGSENGRIIYFRNRGTSECPLFFTFSSYSRECFPMRAGSAVIPTFRLSEDSTLILLTGNAQGELTEYVAEYTPDDLLPNWHRQTYTCIPDVMNPAPCFREVEGELGVFIGSKEGGVYIEGNNDTLLLSTPGTYTVPALVDISGDGKKELLIGTREGGVWYRNIGNDTFPGDWIQLNGLPDIPSGSPAPFGNGIVFGCADGTLKYFIRDLVSGEWYEEKEHSPFAGICTGEYSAPAFTDIDRDGTVDLIIGNGRGILTLFMLEDGDGENRKFIEKHSWRFSPNSAVSNVEDYYRRYFRPFTEMRVPSDTSVVNAFCREIMNANPLYRDEIAYCIANTPTEILREMYRNDDSDIFTRNAEIIYETADMLNYVNLIEEDDGSTSLSLLTLNDRASVTGENYYKYTVHPRVMFEIPARVNAGFWLDSLFADTLSEEEIMRYDVEDLYGSSAEHVFWRNFIPHDTTYGASLLESMRKAETYEEAVFRLSNYLSWCQPNTFMRFGYKSNDLQPMVIYVKAYGSCGEQSILQTALCRAMFIPAYVVGCRGEDHQWNHYLDPLENVWKQWDINNPTANIGHIWLSGEGNAHAGKTISTITAFSPDDVISFVTRSAAAPENSGYMYGDSGYTETAHVEIMVTDSRGVPVEGGMVLARSHWDNRNMVSGIEYTDIDGTCFFDLGWEPFGGYTIDVITPFGTCGSSNLNVDEGKEYNIHYQVPGVIPEARTFTFRNVSEGSPDYQLDYLSSGNTESSFLFPQSFYSGQLYALSDSADNEGKYNGAKWFPMEFSFPASAPLLMDETNFSLFRNGMNCEVIPFGGIEDGLKYIVLDNTGSMLFWKDFSGSCSISPFRGIPHISTDDNSDYAIQERAPVYNPYRHMFEDTTSLLQIPAITRFENQLLEQDDPEDPLSACWTFGPFTIDENERSMLIVSSGVTSGLDMDLYLFRDRNGNRIMDSMNELEEKSTSPSANETIFIPEPDSAGVFWILMQGWNVPDDTGYVNLGLSFDPNPLRIASLTPSGHVSEKPDEYSFRLTDILSTDEELRVYFGNYETEPVFREERWYFFHPNDMTENYQPSAVIANTDGVIVEIAEWNVCIDSVPPIIHDMEISIDTLSMQLNAIVCAEDETEISAALMHIENMSELVMRKSESLSWTGSANLIDRSGGTCIVSFQFSDNAGNETVSESCTLSVPERPLVIFHSIFPQGIVYDHHPVIQVMIDLRDSCIPTGIIAVIEDMDGNTLCELQPIISDEDIFQFLPSEYIEDGNYTARILLFDADNEIEAVHEWDFEVGTMEDMGYQTVWE